MDGVFLIPLVAGTLFCLVAGPLGSFMIWKRLSFFGDVLAHATLLGLALSAALSLSPLIAVCLVAVLIGVFMSFTKEEALLSKDTWLSLLAQGALALGLFVFALFPRGRFSLSQALFGDLLAMEASDLLLMAAVIIPSFFLLMRLWKPLLLVTIHEDLAAVEGVSVQRVKTLFMMILALCIGVTSTYFGILLLSAMLVLPAVIARFTARAAAPMACLASLIGLLGFLGGLFVSNMLDTPVGASVVLTHMVLLMGMALRARFKRHAFDVSS